MEDVPSKKPWYKTGWGILAILALWPFSLSYWIWKRNWKDSIRIVLIVIIWMIVAFWIGSFRTLTSFEKSESETLKSPVVFNPSSTVYVLPSETPIPPITLIPEVTTTPTITSVKPTATRIPIPTITLTSTPIPSIAFDKNLGNNWIAAAQAADFLRVGNNAAPGIIKGVFVELVPEDVGNKDIETYKKSVVSAFVQVKISSSFWNSLDENSMKDFTASWVTATKNVFSAFPHIYIKNEVRTVAEGEWSLWNGEPKVTLK